MKKLIVLGLLASLAACGGQSVPDNQNAQPAPTDTLPSPFIGEPHIPGSTLTLSGSVGKSSALVVDAVTKYGTATNQIYVSYFGRPADPAGLKYWSEALASSGAPTTIQAIEAAYDSNPGIHSIIDSFGTSAESKALYTGSTADFINSIYLNVLGRPAESDGKAWWANLIDKGVLTRARAAVSIMSGALNTRVSNPTSADAVTVDYKTQAAVLFTTGLNTDAKVAAYSGLGPSAVARTMLNAITSQVPESTIATTVTSGISTISPVVVVTPPVVVVPPVVTGDPTKYNALANQLYLAYLGRPIDPVNMKTLTAALLQISAPTTLQGLDNIYATSFSVRTLIDGLANSAESRTLYAGSNSAFVSTVYQIELGRAPSVTESSAWVSKIVTGAMPHDRFPMSIMLGAMYTSTDSTNPTYLDYFTITRRIDAASTFTAALDTDAKVTAYAGSPAAAAAAREMLTFVVSTVGYPELRQFATDAANGVWTIAPCASPIAVQPVVLWDRSPMVPICNGVYAEPGLTANEQYWLRQAVGDGIQRVTTFYGKLLMTQPDIILCKTDACRRYFMGSWLAGVTAGPGTRLDMATYITPRTSILVPYPKTIGYARGTIGHELAHAELWARIGDKNAWNVPQWFNEGHAVLIGHSPVCVSVTIPVIADLRALDNPNTWHAAVGGVNGLAIYCQAEHEVKTFVDKYGTTKFLSVLDGIKAGTPFYTLYGPMLTQ